MNDVSSDLREMFRRREADLPASIQPPPDLTRRVRRRQASTALLAAATAIFVFGAGVLTYRVVDRTGTYVPASQGAGGKVAHVGPVTITYPSSWQVTVYERLADLARPASKIALTNFEANPMDEDLCAAMPATGVILVIHDATELPPEGEPEPWPVPLRPTPAPEHCGMIEFNGSAWWRAGPHNLFTADAFVGPRASDADRERLLESFDGMSFPGDAGPGARGAVLASGVIEGRPWTLSVGLSQGAAAYGPYIGISSGGEGGGLGGFSTPVSSVDLSGAIALSAEVMHGNTFLLGFVREDVASVRVDPDAGDPFATPLYDLPVGVDASFRTFVAPMKGAPRGTVEIFDASGTRLAEVAFAAGTSCGGEEPCTGDVASDNPLQTWSLGEARWNLVHEGDALRLVDDDGETQATVSGQPDPLLLESVTVGTGGEKTQIAFGIASPETSVVLMVVGDLPSGTPTAVLPNGSVAFWVGLSPPSDAAQFLAFDSECRLLGAVELATELPPTEPAEAECQS